MLVTKSGFKLIFVLSNYQTCTFPLKLGRCATIYRFSDCKIKLFHIDSMNLDKNGEFCCPLRVIQLNVSISSFNSIKCLSHSLQSPDQVKLFCLIEAICLNDSSEEKTNWFVTNHYVSSGLMCSQLCIYIYYWFFNRIWNLKSHPRRSEHTDRNVELKPTVLFRTTPTH